MGERWSVEDPDDLDQLLDEVLADPVARAAYDDTRCRDELLEQMVNVRKGAGLSQTQVADVMGTTQSAVSELESAHIDPRLSTLQRYARAVGQELRVALVEGGEQSVPKTTTKDTDPLPVAVANLNARSVRQLEELAERLGTTEAEAESPFGGHSDDLPKSYS